MWEPGAEPDPAAAAPTDADAQPQPQQEEQELPIDADAPKPTEDLADTGPVAASIGSPPKSSGPSVEQPPVPDPPTASTQDGEGSGTSLPAATAVEAAPTDSLSLLQLRRIVAEVHRAEPLAYDFEYTDMAPLPEEIDEWFTYQFWQWVRLNAAQRAFEWHWDNKGNGASAAAAGDSTTSPAGWDSSDNETRTRFVRAAISGIQSNDAALRSASIGKLVYLVLGRWGDTALPNAPVDDCRSVASVSQLQAIRAGVECLASLDGLPVVWEALRANFEMRW